MNKFKVGDIVKRISSKGGSGIKIGDIDTIIGIGGNGWLILDKHQNGGSRGSDTSSYTEECFELIESSVLQYPKIPENCFNNYSIY